MLTSPGVPDIYQGMELFQFNLVDPDNRRPIDFNHRKLLFHELQTANQSPEEFRKHLHQFVSDLDGDKAKLYLTWKTLCLRKSNAALFREGRYTPLSIIGPQSDHVVAFTRQHEGQIAIILHRRMHAA